MFSDYAKDRIIELVAVIELSLILVGVMFYYLFLLPQQQEKCQRGNSRGTSGISQEAKIKTQK